jgi:polysaccharide deacetylase 2 family uncharacterized protein YibQ
MLNTTIKKIFFPIKLLALLLGFTLLSPKLFAGEQPIVIIIIDDMGNSLALGQQAVALPGPINLAFLPYSPNSVMLAEQANYLGNEVLLHAPMSNILGRPLGPGGLKQGMSRQQFLYTLGRDINSVPHVKGVNNHMGSLLTQMQEPMAWLMQSLKQRELYFIDSRTSAKTIALAEATKQKIPNLSRDVFLDNVRTNDAISKQFEQLLSIAQAKGIAVGIGHPYPETIAFLKQSLPSLTIRGYQLSRVSSALRGKDTSCQQYFILNILDKNCHQSLQLSLLSTTN